MVGKRAYIVVQDEYELCECDCGCERDGAWHFEGGIGCRCLNLSCVCVRDSPGHGVLDRQPIDYVYKPYVAQVWVDVSPQDPS